MSATEPIYVVVSPAYGKDYQTKQQALYAWENGADFVLESPVSGQHPQGRYCSARNFAPDDTIEIRFHKKWFLVLGRGIKGAQE